MTSTTKQASGKGPGSGNGKGIGDGWDDAPQATSTGSDGPQWCPQWSNFKPEALANKLTTVPEGSHAELVVIGKLAVAQAFGEPRYFVDTDNGRLAMPNHDVLTGALDKYPIEPAPTVRLAYLGDAARAKPGQRAAIMYDVRAKSADGKPLQPMTKPRDGALLPIHHENKRLRDAAKAAAAKAAGKDDE